MLQIDRRAYLVEDILKHITLDYDLSRHTEKIWFKRYALCYGISKKKLNKNQWIYLKFEDQFFVVNIDFGISNSDETIYRH